jgi:hypothetical protein
MATYAYNINLTVKYESTQADADAASAEGISIEAYLKKRVCRSPEHCILDPYFRAATAVNHLKTLPEAAITVTAV